jgi:RHS repeat-associated protein
MVGYEQATLVFYQVKNDSLYTKEFYMYGSNRLGYLEDDVFLGRKCIGKWCNVLTPVLPMFPSTLSNSVSVVFGKKKYELSDWLGNVRVVINDRKTPVNSGNATVGYKAQVVSVTDYYSFGSEIAERTYEVVKPLYRFGFQAQEKDNEIYGKGNTYYFKFREHDARIGRFWSVDPLAAKYPWNSPYAFAMNRLIDGIELEGKEWYSSGKFFDYMTGKYQINYDIKVKVMSADPTKIKTENAIEYFNSFKFDTESILSNKNAKGSFEDPVINVNIYHSEDATIQLFISEDWIISSKSNKKLNGECKGNSQWGIIRITTKSTEGISSTLAHELGHLAGLNHPWEVSNDMDPSTNPEIDIKQSYPLLENMKTKIKNNLMNSGGNPINELKGRTSKDELTRGQREKIENTVQKEQK